MTLIGKAGITAALAVTGAAVAIEWPEIQRYLKIRAM
jgi:hypothetical protein